MGNRLHFLKLIIILSFSGGIVSCDDIFETDIHDKEVVLITPGKSVLLKRLDVTFWWEEIQGVSEFQIQVVSPSFNTSEHLWIDSVITNNKFVLSLESGTYEWRVKGKNGAYETSWSEINSFSIDSAIDISLQKARLTAPSDGFVQNSETVEFQWQEISIADDYLLKIRNESFTLDTVIFTNSVSLVVEEASGNYTWNVTARKENNVGKISDTWRFKIDLTAPDIPRQLIPKNDSTFVGYPLTLKWESNDADKKEDLLYIFTDADATTLVDGFPLRLRETTFTFDQNDTKPLEAGIYYWSVKTIDNAGNESASSEIRKFTFKAS